MTTVDGFQSIYDVHHLAGQWLGPWRPVRIGPRRGVRWYRLRTFGTLTSAIVLDERTPPLRPRLWMTNPV